MEEKKVKGSLLMDYVRLIRAFKDKNWDKYLEPGDREIIDGRIMPSVWYPFDLWQRCGLAVFEELVGGNMEAAKAWGRMNTEQLFKGIYKAVMADQDPVKVMERFISMSGQLYNFTAISMEKAGDRHVKIHVATDPDIKGMDAYLMQVRGGLEYLIDSAGGKNPKIEIVAKKKDKTPGINLEVKWE